MDRTVETKFLKKRSSIITQLESSKESKDLEKIIEKEALNYIIISFKPEGYSISIKDKKGIVDVSSVPYIEDDEFVKNLDLGMLSNELFAKFVSIYDAFYLHFVIAKIQKFSSSTDNKPEYTFKLLHCAKKPPVVSSTTQVKKIIRYPVLNSSTNDFESRKRAAEKESELELNDPEMKSLIEKFYSFCSSQDPQNENKKVKMDETQDLDIKNYVASDIPDSSVSLLDCTNIQYSAGSSVDKMDDEVETFETAANSTQSSEDKMDYEVETFETASNATQSSEELFLSQSASDTGSITENSEVLKPYKGYVGLRDIFKNELSHIKQEEKIRVCFSFEEQFAFLNDDNYFLKDKNYEAAKAPNDDEAKSPLPK